METINQYLITLAYFSWVCSYKDIQDWQVTLGIADYYVELDILEEMIMELGRS